MTGMAKILVNREALHEWMLERRRTGKSFYPEKGQDERVTAWICMETDERFEMDWREIPEAQ